MFFHKVNKQQKNSSHKGNSHMGTSFSCKGFKEWDSVAMDERRDETSCHPLGFALHAGIAASSLSAPSRAIATGHRQQQSLIVLRTSFFAKSASFSARETEVSDKHSAGRRKACHCALAYTLIIAYSTRQDEKMKQEQKNFYKKESALKHALFF